ncbi:hypothetical protein PACTADRAFT_49145 [Pachysolen tannophilus NRRL Y-2460]|uniref:DAGKc domain-containing protein n=1 Tax=Pachysolen tannophilus NRRL Y-2460 TaxID=669874 RepID=A0A1E4U0A6_PACTA|nr:hypothetical protein PACTADRAFT_49145 [Pachysolen tannophilus NRRL Y-2460]
MANEELLFIYKDDGTGVSTLLCIESTDTSYELKEKVLENVPEDSKVPEVPEVPVVLSSSLPAQFKQDNLVVIDSVNSGTGRSEFEKDLYSKILGPILKKLGISHTYFKTTSSSSISEFAKSIELNHQSYLIIFISGDTSINEFLNSLPIAVNNNINTPLYIANISAGTGNALMSSLGANSPIQCIQQLFVGSPSKFHLYETQFKPSGGLNLQNNQIVSKMLFFAVTSWCFHSSLVADSDTPELRKLGVSRFGVAAQQNLEKEQRYDGDLKISNFKDKTIISEINGPYSYLVITPLTNFEEKFKISPLGNVKENSLYIIELGFQQDNNVLLDVMKEVYDNGSHIKDEKVNYLKVEDGKEIHLKINSTEDSKLRFCVDGTIIKLIHDTDENLELVIKGGVELPGWDLFLVV